MTDLLKDCLLGYRGDVLKCRAPAAGPGESIYFLKRI